VEQIVQANNVVAPRRWSSVSRMYAQAYEIPRSVGAVRRGVRSIAESQVRRDLVLDFVVESRLARHRRRVDARIQQLAERARMPGAVYASLEKASGSVMSRGAYRGEVFAYLCRSPP